MKKIGLIGGMSFESTAVYYHLLNQIARERLGPLASAEILLHSVNFADIVPLQKAGRWSEAGEILGNIAANLERAGADCMLICTNTMHKVADAVTAKIHVPLIHIVDETAGALWKRGLSRPLLLATAYTMSDGFYQVRMEGHGISVMVPDEIDRKVTHDIIFDELCAGKIFDSSRQRLLAIIEKARTDGADSVILGCTEICLILDPDALVLPGIDTTRLHAQAAMNFALGGHEAFEKQMNYA